MSLMLGGGGGGGDNGNANKVLTSIGNEEVKLLLLIYLFRVSRTAWCMRFRQIQINTLWAAQEKKLYSRKIICLKVVMNRGEIR